MKTLHSNARTCPRSRRLLVDRVLVEGWSLVEAAAAAGVSERTAWKWVARSRREGEAGLEDRASTPKTVPARTPAEREELILSLRELRFTSPEIAGDARNAALHGRRRPRPARAGETAAAAAGRAGQQVRAAETGRAGAHRRQEARSVCALARRSARIAKVRRERTWPAPDARACFRHPRVRLLDQRRPPRRRTRLSALRALAPLG